MCLKTPKRRVKLQLLKLILMNYNKSFLDKVFYSDLYNSQHRRTKNINYLKFIIKNILHLFKRNHKTVKISEESILFFSTESFFDVNLLKKKYKIISYKENISKSIRIDFKHEETLMLALFLLPSFFKKILFPYIIKSIKSKINGINIKLFICNYPELISSAVGLALKEENVKIVTVQHGIYEIGSYKPLFFETDIATHCYVWGIDYKNWYSECGIKKDKIIVVAPPFTISYKSKSDDKLNPVYLGQQLYKVTNEIYEPYNKIIAELIKFYKTLGCNLTYKPHPREKVNKSLSKSNINNLIIINNQNVDEDFFNEYTHAYSINSTALIRALCSGLNCFQINPKLRMATFDFSKYSSIKRLEVSEIAGHYNKRNSKNKGNNENFINPTFLNFQKFPKSYNSNTLLQFLEISNF